MKKLVVLLLVACLLCTVLAACGKKEIITADEAYQIALDKLEKDYKITEELAATATRHIHETTVQGLPCFNIYITVGEASFQCVVTNTGDVLHCAPGEAHTH